MKGTEETAAVETTAGVRRFTMGKEKTLEPNVVLATADHLEGMVECHCAAFPGEFLTLMGKNFLSSFYGFYNVHPESISLVAVDDDSNRVMGLVTGGRPDLRSIFLRKHVLLFMTTAFVKAFGHARIRQRLLEHFADLVRSIGMKLGKKESSDSGAPPDDPPGTWSNLLSICTHPDFRRRGVSQALMKGFEKESHRRGYASMRLSVHNDNPSAIGLYKKCGWDPVLVTSKGTYFKRTIDTAP